MLMSIKIPQKREEKFPTLKGYKTWVANGIFAYNLQRIASLI